LEGCIFSKIRFICACLFLLALFGIGSAECGWAQIEIGFRAGENNSICKESFQQRELIFRGALPWEYRINSDFSISTQMEITAGKLECGRDRAFLASLGPSIIFSYYENLIDLDAGISPTLVTEYEFHHKNIGGFIQFTSHVGIYYSTFQFMKLGYRFQHMSNASLYEHNPGINLHLFEARFRF
jgi:lipid A 3-O-deacylase